MIENAENIPEQLLLYPYILLLGCAVLCCVCLGLVGLVIPLGSQLAGWVAAHRLRRHRPYSWIFGYG